MSFNKPIILDLSFKHNKEKSKQLDPRKSYNNALGNNAQGLDKKNTDSSQRGEMENGE